MSSSSYTADRTVSAWLLVVALMVLSMVALGGLTRLTQSGLSMVDWKLIMGILPPMSDSEWNAAFEAYKQYPEFRLKNPDMTVEGFKSIFWLEYFHRLLGRLLGLVFLLPFIYFSLKGRITPNLRWKFVGLFVLGGLQGGMGWFMVKSGLVDNPHVSYYRLTAHLGIAVLIYVLIFWMWLQITFGSAGFTRNTVSRQGLWLAGLVFLMILSGGFVAGSHAGLAWNTFPTMGGYWIPDAVYHMEPFWLSAFEDITTIQFNHRVLAAVIFISVLVFVFRSWPIAGGNLKVTLVMLVFTLLGQLSLGVLTLLNYVPVGLASGHQMGAFLLLSAVIISTHVATLPGQVGVSEAERRD